MQRIGTRYVLQPGDGYRYNVFVFDRGLIGLHTGDYGLGPCIAFDQGVSSRYTQRENLLIEGLAKGMRSGQPAPNTWIDYIHAYRDRYVESSGHTSPKGGVEMFPKEPRPIVSNAPLSGGYYKGCGGIYLAMFVPLSRSSPQGVVSISTIGTHTYDIKHSYSNAPTAIRGMMTEDSLLDIILKTGYRDAAKTL